MAASEVVGARDCHAVLADLDRLLRQRQLVADCVCNLDSIEGDDDARPLLLLVVLEERPVEHDLEDCRCYRVVECLLASLEVVLADDLDGVGPDNHCSAVALELVVLTLDECLVAECHDDVWRLDCGVEDKRVG